MRYFFTLLILALVSSFSYADSPLHHQLELKSSYQVEWIGKRPLIDASYLNIVLDKDNKAYGLAGCNYWSTHYQLENNSLRFDSAIKVTKKTCAPALMEQEQRLLKTLPNVIRWDFSELGQLLLWTKDGEAIKLWLEKSNHK